MHISSIVHRCSSVEESISFAVKEWPLSELFVIQTNEGRQILLMAGGPLLPQ